jgi:hypothetical protein
MTLAVLGAIAGLCVYELHAIAKTLDRIAESIDRLERES